MADQAVSERRGREGGRWVNERPTSAEFATWFAESMKLDAALSHDKYIGGVVLIPAVDTKAKYVTGFSSSGIPLIEEREELSYIPYAKVETRIDYYWDLLDAHEDWVGVIKHVESPRMPIDPVLVKETTGEDGITLATEYAKPGALAGMVYQLPEGNSVLSVPVGEGYSHFLCCTIRVSIWNREEWKALTPDERKELAATGVGALRTGRGTKQVPLLMGRSNPWADPNSLMKAETGALGRALGFAGIFIIPGSGVATAEDMLESLAQGTTVAQEAPAEGNAGPAAPTEAPVRTGAEQSVDEEAELKQKALTLFKALSEGNPEKAAEFTHWAHHDRKLTKLSDARGAMLRGVVRKLERLTDEALQGAPDEPVPGAEGTPAPAEGETAAEGEQHDTPEEPDVNAAGALPIGPMPDA